MKHLHVLILSILISSLTAIASDFPNESLRYKVEYKWGLVNKTAGHVSIKLRNSGAMYYCDLTAASAPWADKIYKVRDTLHCEIIKNGFLPQIYEKHSHEGGDRKLDVVKYSYSGQNVFGNCTRKAWKDGKIKRDQQLTLQTTGTTVDMLSAFFYMRNLPYASWQKGHVHSLTVFSGKRKELLSIKYLGLEEIKINKSSYWCYHIKFTFTSDGKKKTSDDMDALIDSTGAHIPMRLEGSLPIGKVRCFYEGA